MANKSVYQNFDNDALTYFGLAADPLYGLVTSTGVEKVLCTQDEKTYDKIHSILTVPTEDDQTFRTKKKAFILPRCGVSQDRLKAALKEHSITVTNDYELADLIIGHDDISTDDKLSNGENIPSTIMMNKLWNYETTFGDKNSIGVLKKISDANIQCIVTPKVTDKVRYYDIDMHDNILDVWMLSGMAVNLAHIINTTDVSVIDTETVLHASATRLVLDEQLLADLKAQLNSYSDDKALAIKIVPTIDYTKNYHLLWQLAQDCGSLEYADNRDKDLQYWLDVSKFVSFGRKSAQTMINWLEVNDKLCKTTFRYLEPIVRSEISIQNRDLYTFKVSVKKEYLKYLKN